MDHGLFQISDKYWCVEGQVDGACGIDCKGDTYHLSSNITPSRNNCLTIYLL